MANNNLIHAGISNQPVFPNPLVKVRGLHTAIDDYVWEPILIRLLRIEDKLIAIRESSERRFSTFPSWLEGVCTTFAVLWVLQALWRL
jgi:hypothetical protein